MKTGVVIVNHNQKDLLAACLRSWRKSATPVTLLVSDNASTDGAPAMLAAEFPEVKVLAHPRELGFAAAANAGLQALAPDHDFIFLTTNDTEVEPGLITRLLEAAGDGVAVVGPKILYHADPGQIWFAGGKVGAWTGTTLHEGLLARDDGAFDARHDCDFASGCGMLLRTAAAGPLGWLRGELAFYAEDTDLCFRLRKAGWRVVFEPSARMFHRISATLKSGSPLTAYYCARNGLAQVWRHRLGRFWPLSFLLYAGVMLPRFCRTAFRQGFRHGWAYTRATALGARHFFTGVSGLRDPRDPSKPFGAAALILAAGLGLASLVQAGGVPAPAEAGVNTPWYKVNTVGYPAHWPKLAVVNVDLSTASCCRLALREADSGRLVKPLALRPGTAKDAASGEDTWLADFSEVTATGRYRLVYGPDGQSGPAGAWHRSEAFEIAAKPYDRALLAAQKMFYYQRTRTELREPYTLWGPDDDDYTRPVASHAHGDVGWVLDHYPDKKERWKPVKGWFDAGNYDMYIPSTAPSAQMLLWAYELSPQAFGDANGIPESGNGIPDILDEAVWGLDWILSLQTREGAFRAREATLQLGTVPEGTASKDRTERWVSGIASASTAKAVAVLAKAARLYKPFARGRSEDYARAAQKGWAWLKANPQRVTFNSHGSAQPLWDDGPEYPQEAGSRAAAAFELWRSFRLKDAFKDLQARWMDGQLSAEGLHGGWPNIGRFAVLGALLDDAGPGEMRAEARRRLFEAVKPLRARVRQDGYRCALRPDEYYWGSPAVLLEKAALLALAARVDPRGHAWALEAARDQWHWILGRNPNGWSLVSRVGRGPTRVYHTEWGKKRLPPPGFLVDGPNHHNAAFLSPSAPAKALLWHAPRDLASGVKAGDPWHNDQRDLWEGGFVPANRWDTGWWVVTEVDIYYNAALVLAAALITP